MDGDLKILILTYGSRGDVQPYIALGKRLRSERHEVVLATSERFDHDIRAEGLAFDGLSDDMLHLLDADEGRNVLEKSSNIIGILIQLFAMLRKVGPMQKALVADCWTVARRQKPDLIIYHPKTYAAPDIGEKLNRPVVLTMLAPMMVPTSERANVGFPDLKIGGWYNRATYKVVNWIMSVSSGKFRSEFREKVGLPKRPRPSLMYSAAGKHVPVLHAHSQHVISQPADWPPEAVTTGYWFLDARKNWTPSKDLEAFIEAGDAPVYIGFGSMAGKNPEKISSIILEAVEAAGVRAILATGWGGINARNLPGNVHVIDQAPHDWLFPKMAAVVHHGGAGTTAAGLRAGKPTLVIPFMGDQPFWGKRVAEIGAGPPPIPQKKLSVSNLSNALMRLVEDPSLARQADAIGRKIRQEDGTGCAADMISGIGRDQSE